MLQIHACIGPQRQVDSQESLPAGLKRQVEHSTQESLNQIRRQISVFPSCPLLWKGNVTLMICPFCLHWLTAPAKKGTGSTAGSYLGSPPALHTSGEAQSSSTSSAWKGYFTQCRLSLLAWVTPQHICVKSVLIIGISMAQAVLTDCLFRMPSWGSSVIFCSTPSRLWACSDHFTSFSFCLLGVKHELSHTCGQWRPRSVANR